ncbi:RpiB/LacA/LacB family sugar-phosphate isomerase [Candidatus Enterococcus murrayae]|uniref:RpiB/LacA/LacB family sugar-phosphate isomerase n=1 Tax=Candidatus Enterococcus murrayae TaxID=2815321 RepID=A0ABS3HLA0_9ENTE|nr:RpiB/LacA/LacB family sugar-phosphate isomerase [Enterococcus sp. MJM16]MBO0454224.1 RpiB/LacA/LacB family sugar-phosphate isomerase [Enterococcus sp. MJM16]
MKIGFGADENAVEFKDELKKYAEDLGYEVIDYGYFLDKPVDYPSIAFEVAESIDKGEIDRGILCCGTGIGMAIAANKVPGIRAAQITDVYSAERAQLSNNAQIGTFGAFVQGIDSCKLLMKEYLSQNFEHGTRSERKVNQISEFEKAHTK